MADVAPTGHLEMHTTRTGDRKWRAVIHDANGRRTKILGPMHARASGKTPRGAVNWVAGNGPCPDGHLTPKVARDMLATMLAEAPRRARSSSAKATFGEVVEQWYADRAMRTTTTSTGAQELRLTEATRKTYRGLIDRYLVAQPEGERPAKMHTTAPFATVAMDRLSAEIVEEWYDAFPSSRTKDQVFVIVRAVLRRAHERGLTDTNLGTGLERADRQYAERGAYSVEEVRKIVHAAEEGAVRTRMATGQGRGAQVERERTPMEEIWDLRDAAMILVAGMAGPRRGELLGLDWRHVVWSDRRHGPHLHVEQNWSRNVLGRTKGRKERPVPMLPEVAEMLRRWERATPYAGPDDPVFPNQAGGRQDVSKMGKRYMDAVARADAADREHEGDGITYRPLHAMRHTFATRAMHATKDPAKVMGWAGHEDLRTANAYLHPVTEDGDADLLAGGFL